LPQQELFEYKDENGKYRDIESQDVNDYLKSITGKDITAKDFRTWGATTYAGKSLHKKGNFQTKREAIKNIRETVIDVSKKLQNTTTVCKEYYIHPQVVSTYEEKILIPYFDEIYKKRYSPKHLYIHEFATWSLLKEHKQ
jgi:DNA topoisomerase-1